MQSIHAAISGLKPGAPQVFENLAVFPLFGGAGADFEYLVLDEALDGGIASVTEISEGGSVPELAFENRGPDPVLLLDGEELVGAKQNRVLNLTILAPPKATITIPVTCVEAGRWAWTDRHFRAGARAQYASLRSRKMSQVSMSLAADGTAAADQNAVWDDISAKMRRMNAHSASEAMSDLYEHYHRRLDEFVRAFSAGEGQVGAVFVVDGEARGVEIFARPETFSRQFGKLLQSWALDAIESPSSHGTQAERAAAERLLADVAALEGRNYEAVGLGEDVRLEGEDLGGGALMVGGHVVHLCAFRKFSGQSPRERPSRSSRSRAGRNHA
jgi:hypothetical protein